jgi:hypothetical protein
MNNRVIVFVVGCGLVLSAASGALAADPKLPASVVIATHAAGSGFHADGSALAKLVAERLRMTMVVRPHPGPPAWLPAMNGLSTPSRYRRPACSASPPPPTDSSKPG